jgi:lipoyl synthase
LRAPQWLVSDVRRGKRGGGAKLVARTHELLGRLHLPTVCEEARCPNQGECYSLGIATFLILGEVCTRACAFCGVSKGRPWPVDADEPRRLAQAVGELRLRHVVITSVTRDDLPDGGAAHFARVVETLRKDCQGVTVELLVPDFAGSADALATILAASPDILAHNLETVPRLYSTVRKGADYSRSLRLLKQTKQLHPGIVTKSGLMLGLGEQAKELPPVLEDLRAANCDMLTLGQYLSPSLRHAQVARYVTREEFDAWSQRATALGFRSVAAGSLVRSSYQATAYFEKAL